MLASTCSAAAATSKYGTSSQYTCAPLAGSSNRKHSRRREDR